MNNIPKASEFFQTLHNPQVAPFRPSKEDTNYTILRAVVMDHNALKEPIKKAKYHDFAIMWYRHYDHRVVKIIEEIYYHGFLQYFHIFYGIENTFYAVLNKKGATMEQDSYDDLRNKMEAITADYSEKRRSAGDKWELHIISDINNSYFNMNHITSLIEVSRDEILEHLNNIDLRWKLGTKDIEFPLY